MLVDYERIFKKFFGMEQSRDKIDTEKPENEEVEKRTRLKALYFF